MKRHIFTSCFACFFAFSIFAHAQATPTAERSGSLQLGAAGSLAVSDYADVHDKGPTFYGTFDFTRHIGLEADVHYTSMIAEKGIAESSFLMGPRYVINHRRFSPYAKLLCGIGQLNLQLANVPRSKASNFAYALGAGLDYKVTPSINVRAFDFEYQEWSYLTGLTPLVMTIGVAYQFH